jgi:hypothetical protein
MLIAGLEPIAIYREILPFDKAVEPSSSNNASVAGVWLEEGIRKPSR